MHADISSGATSASVSFSQLIEDLVLCMPVLVRQVKLEQWLNKLKEDISILLVLFANDMVSLNILEHQSTYMKSVLYISRMKKA